MNKCERNQQALIDLLEFYLLFGICDTHASSHADAQEKLK